MEGSFLHSPFYPKAGGAGGGHSAFRILSFSNDSPINEKGIPLSQAQFTWSYSGMPDAQSITPIVGDVPITLRSISVPGQSINGTTMFTLSASDENHHRTATTQVSFVDPIFYGTVPSAAPSVAEIMGMNKRVALFEPFRASLVITDEHSCFASPMAFPIVDIEETVFGLSVFGTYNILNNVPLIMADGLVEPYRVIVKAVPEHTLGRKIFLDVVF